MSVKISKVACCKRKLKTKTVTEKYKTAKEVDKGNHCLNKKKIIEKSGKTKFLRKELGCESPYMKIWLLNARHQSIPVTGTIVKKKMQKNLVVIIFKHDGG